MASSIPCPCGSSLNYNLCCGRYHKGKLHAPTAEALMRSRYSAYVLGHTHYIYRTWDKQNRPPLAVLKEDNSQQFTHLEIISTTKGNKEDSSGTVEFIASYHITEQISAESKKDVFKHHENSYFEKQNNKWKYINTLSKIDSVD